MTDCQRYVNSSISTQYGSREVDAYIPNPEIEIDPTNFQEELNKIKILEDNVKTRIENFENTALIGRQLRIIESFFSSKIEGVDGNITDFYINYEPTVLVNYYDTLTEINSYEYTLQGIQSIHNNLYKNTQLLENVGNLREVQNFIGTSGTILYVPPPPDYVEQLISRLVNTDIDNIADAVATHYIFEAIHPFIDGNGRVGRLLLQKHIQDTIPTSFSHPISRILFNRRQTYYKRLRAASEYKEVDKLVEFLLKCLIESIELTMKIATKLIERKQVYTETLEQVTTKSEELTPIFLDFPVFTKNLISNKSNVSYSTVSKVTNELATQNIVTEITGKDRNQIFQDTDLITFLFKTG